MEYYVFQQHILLYSLMKLNLNSVWIFMLRGALFKFNYLHILSTVQSHKMFDREKLSPSFLKSSLLTQMLEITKSKKCLICVAF